MAIPTTIDGMHLVFLWALIAVGPAHAAEPPRSTAELLAVTEAVEEATEALAKQLNAASESMRGGDVQGAVSGFSAAQISLALPTKAGPIEPLVGHVSVRQWSIAEASKVELDGAASAFDGLLVHVAQIEDLRFKITASEVNGDEMTGRVATKIVGRDADGRRMWFRVGSRFQARRDGRRWRVTEWHAQKASSQHVEVDAFTDVTEGTGAAAESKSRPRGMVAGIGVATADVNLDGWLDVYAAGGFRSWLYLNTGDGRFQATDGPETTTSGVIRRTTAPLFLDYDRDGDPDLFLSVNEATQKLFRNEMIPSGKPEFTDVSEASGVAHWVAGHSATTADVDGDGWLDIYVTSYNAARIDDLTQGTKGTRNVLFMGSASGVFREAGKAWGVDDRRWGLAAEFVDLDSDGDPDLLLANDWGGGNTWFRNEGDHFVDVGAEVGLFERANGMGVQAADVDNDGDLDVHFTNMTSTAGKRILRRIDDAQGEWVERARYMAQGNTLYVNDAGSFTIRDRLGSGWSWGGGFFDLNNDGRLDSYTPNGMISGKRLDDA